MGPLLGAFGSRPQVDAPAFPQVGVTAAVRVDYKLFFKRNSFPVSGRDLRWPGRVSLS